MYESSAKMPPARLGLLNQSVRELDGAVEGELKRGLIACEFSELNRVVIELEEISSRLAKKLSPILLEREDKPPLPANPQAALPALGSAVRDARQRVETCIERLHRLDATCEL